MGSAEEGIRFRVRMWVVFTGKCGEPERDRERLEDMLLYWLFSLLAASSGGFLWG